MKENGIWKGIEEQMEFEIEIWNSIEERIGDWGSCIGERIEYLKGYRGTKRVWNRGIRNGIAERIGNSG